VLGSPLGNGHACLHAEATSRLGVPPLHALLSLVVTNTRSEHHRIVYLLSMYFCIHSMHTYLHAIDMYL
jgi:hypothetical protein